MKPIRILSVAPYEQLQQLTSQVAAGFPEIRLDTFTGNLDMAAEYIRGVSLDTYDAILSRGGTATQLRRITGIAVVEVEISVYDMLRTLLAAVAAGKRFAVVGYENTIHTASRLCRILKIDQPLICRVDQRTIGRQLKRLRAQGVELVVGDVIATEQASRLGMESMLLTSSAQSISKALTTAMGYAAASRHKTLESALYQQATELISDGIIILDGHRQVVLINPKAKSVAQDGLLEALGGAIGILEAEEEYTFFHRVKGRGYAIDGRAFHYDSQNYYLFSVRKTGGLPPGNGAVQAETVEQPLEAAFLLADSCGIVPMLDRVCRRSGGKQPVMLWGEVGTEKNAAARYVYRQSPNRTKPMVRIHCPTLTLRQWQELTQAPQAVFSGSGYTIFFENIHQTTMGLQREIGWYLENTQLQRRHFLLASCVGDPNALAVSGQLSAQLYRQLCPITVHMPELDSRREDLDILSRVYISRYSRQLEGQVTGLAPDALECLKRFHWSLNLIQLERVLFQLVFQAKGPTITAQEAQALLERFHTPPRQTGTGFQPDLTQTMDEIQRDIIWQVLQEENMNQSRAAKRLNISRTTVWRRLREGMK